MAGGTSSIKGVFVDFPAPVITNIYREPTREALINLHQLITGNAASVVLNLIKVRHGHLALMMTAKEHMEQTGCEFVPQHNPENYPPTMGTTQ